MEAEFENEKIVQDPIHGHIHLHPLVVKIIDTPEFQRLRSLKQLGLTYFVYPSATNTRFEHCIGTYYLARKMAEDLKSKQEKSKWPNEESMITDRDVICVAVAGLIHDLGHGPFSHTWQNFMERQDSEWMHEQMTQEIFDRIWKNISLDKVPFNERGDTLTDADKHFIKELVVGLSEENENNPDFFNLIGRPSEKKYLFEIVANKMNSIDVDKWDYFLRDCHYLGMESFSYGRLLEFAKVLPVSQLANRLCICYKESEGLKIHHMFYTRVLLHQRAYQHRVARNIELMIIDAFKEVDKDGSIIYQGEGGQKMNISRLDVEAYVKLNDGIYYRILHELPPTHKARKLLESIEKRQLYRDIYETLSDTKPPSAEDIMSSMKKTINNNQVEEFNDNDFIIDIAEFNYGNKDQDPLSRIYFYDNKNVVKRLENESLSTMLPKKFQEFKIRCVYRKMNADGSLDNSSENAVRSAFEAWLGEKRRSNPGRLLKKHKLEDTD